MSKAYSQVHGVPQSMVLQLIADSGYLPPFEIKVMGSKAK